MQYDEIRKKFDRVIQYSQGVQDINTEELFSQWMEAKRDFIEAFGGQLIYEYPDKVSFELDEKEKKARIDLFVDELYNKWGNDGLAEFVEDHRTGFYSNQLDENVTLDDGTELLKGRKLLKCFKYFVNNDQVLNDIQSEASRIIQENKIEGHLCVSVHPLDFISSSENTHKWRSCHALDGEYRAGNLSYMVDKSTFMCYLRSDREEVLPNFPEDVKWNSKKWRVLMFMSDDWEMLFAGRQYPFSTPTGLDFLREKVFPLLHMGEWTKWTDKKIRDFKTDEYYTSLSDSYIAVGRELYKKRDLIINQPGSLMFNDLLSSSCYDPVYCFKKTKLDLWFDDISAVYTYKADRRTKIHVGGTVKCLHCGKHPIELTERMFCNECEIEFDDTDIDVFGTCDCCGRRFVYDDGYGVGDEIICPDCEATETFICPICGERHYNSDKVYDEVSEEYICKNCYEERKGEF
jgi:hypothetical protein